MILFSIVSGNRYTFCEREHISYSYLSQYFKATSLKTFRNFLHEIRVYHSEHLLLCNPDLSIPDIAFACGFSDPKFFYREFRKKHGHTPHQHRIWYRCYNEKTAPDIRYSLSEQQTTLEHLISKLYSQIICEMVKK